VEQDTTVSIANCYRLDDMGIKSQWGWDLPQPSKWAPTPNQCPVE